MPLPRRLARINRVVTNPVARTVAAADGHNNEVGLPLTLSGESGQQAEAARAFAERLERRLNVPVELYDERLTTRLAERAGGSGPEDARAAAHLLESYLASASARLSWWSAAAWRLGGREVCLAGPTAGPLPPALAALLDRSARLYARIDRLDRQLAGDGC